MAPEVLHLCYTAGLRRLLPNRWRTRHPRSAGCTGVVPLREPAVGLPLSGRCSIDLASGRTALHVSGKLKENGPCSGSAAPTMMPIGGRSFDEGVGCIIR